MAQTFHLSLEVKSEKDGEPLHFKHDGERFRDGSPNTIKLNVSSMYAFTVTFRPAKVLTHWMIRGEKVEFERVNPKKAEEDVSIYETHWSSTGVEVSKRGGRLPLGIELEMYPGVVMKMNLQTKFYPEMETTHRKWGPEVHSLEYTCDIPEGQMCVDIVSEKII